MRFRTAEAILPLHIKAKKSWNFLPQKSVFKVKDIQEKERD
jgi:hypothetical protein